MRTHLTLYPSVLFLAVAMYSSSAFSAPKVGDFAQMEGKIVENRVTTALTTIQKITAFDGSRFTIEQTQIIGSQSQTSPVTVGEGDILTEETTAQILSSCDQGIGKLERMKVKAGTFETCRTESDGATIWLGVVPFGVVKIKTKTPGGRVEVELTDFGHGISL